MILQYLILLVGFAGNVVAPPEKRRGCPTEYAVIRDSATSAASGFCSYD